MQKSLNKKKKILLIVIILLAILAIAGGTLYYYKFRNKKISSQDQSNKDSGGKDQSNSENKGQETVDRSQTEFPKGSDPSSSNTAVDGSITITGVYQAGSIITVSTIASGVTEGTCIATFEKPGANSITKTAPLGVQVSYYTCKGFNNISSNEFSSKGDWSVRLIVDTPKGKISSNSQVINIR